MTKAKWAAAAALLSMSAGALADGIYQYESVTQVGTNGFFYGVIVGDTVPTTLAVANSSTKCASWVELMLTSSGQYLLTVTVTTSQSIPAIARITDCSIERTP